MIEIKEEELKKIMEILGEIPSKYSLNLVIFFKQKIENTNKKNSDE